MHMHVHMDVDVHVHVYVYVYVYSIQFFLSNFSFAQNNVQIIYKQYKFTIIEPGTLSSNVRY